MEVLLFIIFLKKMGPKSILCYDFAVWSLGCHVLGLRKLSPNDNIILVRPLYCE